MLVAEIERRGRNPLCLCKCQDGETGKPCRSPSGTMPCVFLFGQRRRASRSNRVALLPVLTAPLSRISRRRGCSITRICTRSHPGLATRWEEFARPQSPRTDRYTRNPLERAAPKPFAGRVPPGKAPLIICEIRGACWPARGGQYSGRSRSAAENAPKSTTTPLSRRFRAP